MSKPSLSITRIQSLTLENFKGFRGRHGPINLDADIVVISGPNGHGKTSLLEALTLALTGWHDLPIEDLISRIPNENNGTENGHSSTPERCACLSLDAVLDGQKKPSRIKWLKGKTKPKHPRLPASRLDDPDDPKQSAELKARLCTFFQDRLGQLFDQSTSGMTLRDVLEPFRRGCDGPRTPSKT